MKQENVFLGNYLASNFSLLPLPPFLKIMNFQLLRFIYDSKTYSKKKVLAPFRFPKSINLSPYVKNDDKKDNSSELSNKPQVYDLKAVLCHKGPSAYSGHYVTHVHDER